MQQGYHPEEAFDVGQMGAFMRRPDIYGPLVDALAPPAEQLEFESYMMEPTTWTMAAMFGPYIIGFVQIVTRTSVMGEMIAGFDPRCRGLVAKRFTEYALEVAIHQRGLLVVIALIPSDNRPARQMVSALGMKPESRLRRCITRIPRAYRGRPAQQPGLYDLITYVYRKEQRN